MGCALLGLPVDQRVNAVVKFPFSVPFVEEAGLVDVGPDILFDVVDLAMAVEVDFPC